MAVVQSRRVEPAEPAQRSHNSRLWPIVVDSLDEECEQPHDAD